MKGWMALAPNPALKRVGGPTTDVLYQARPLLTGCLPRLVNASLLGFLEHQDVDHMLVLFFFDAND